MFPEVVVNGALFQNELISFGNFELGILDINPCDSNCVNEESK